MKGISILGSTGSIGEQTLDIVRLHPHLFRVEALAAGGNVDRLELQVREFHPSIVSLADEKSAQEMKKRLADMAAPPDIVHSVQGLQQAAAAEGSGLVVVGLPGSAGLQPTFAAVKAGKDVALATKEVLVMAGSIFMQTVRECGVKLLPVDSEQSAVFQCLQGHVGAQVKRIVLTASGGPFREMPASLMTQVTKEQTLNHPRWRMGPKVTVDSATLMNKGFEVIEAKWLFDVPASTIDVVIHPQSIIHSMVEFNDGSILAQLGATDMRIPISYALAFPDRIVSGAESVSFPALGSLTFESPDFDRFPLLKAASEVLRDGSTAASIILNASDETAVELFLAGKATFIDISRIVLDSLDHIEHAPISTLEEIMDFHEHVVREVRGRWGN